MAISRKKQEAITKLYNAEVALCKYRGIPYDEYRYTVKGTIQDILNKAEDENGIHDMSKGFYELDKEIKEKLNYLFDADVCTPVVGNGAIIRAVDGQPLFTVIISNLLPLYEKEIENENKKAQARIAKHTAKYAGDKK